MKENCLRPHFSAHKPNTTTHLRYPRTLPSSWCTCTTTLGSTTRVYHSIACHSLSRVERHRLQIAISQQIAIANTQEASWYYIATVMIMPPSFADTIIQQATTHRKLTIAIPIVTIMKSWHQYISSSTPTMWALNLWTWCWRMDDGDAIRLRWYEHTQQYK